MRLLRRHIRRTEERAVGGLSHQIIVADIEDLADVGVVQGGDGARFLLKPCAALGPQALDGDQAMPPAPMGARIS